ncbi:MAG: ATP synthase F1 subunit gamma [Oscillospiraceae bacterium]|nr:ATP synthase F1 subunit gamma [Oscillospiraceae bacterium]
MAGVSMKDIKLRIKSMESTKQITKAMQMVAASKLRHAQERVANSRPYFEILSETMDDIIRSNGEFTSPYVTARPVKAVCYVAIAGDRGLAGGYNSNILKKILGEMKALRCAVCVLPIGKKAAEFFRSAGIPLLTEAYAEAEDVSIGDCFTMAKELSKGFLAGEFDEIYLGWTNFVSVLSQVPATRGILPLVRQPLEAKEAAAEVLYEPSAEAVFDAIVPEYLGGTIYGALCESVASELAARRTAMDAATKNAEEMIGDLSLKYNRARQGAITQEITEIVGGAES